MILICYDGSPDAQTAIEHAGELLTGHQATVLTVWEPFIDAMAASGTAMGLGAAPVNYGEIDAANERAARAEADEGVGLARRAGLIAGPLAAPRGASIAGSIIAEADAIDASAIVLGSRGRTGLSSLLMGSVSHNVLQHADRTVIVVPSAEVSAERAAHRHGRARAVA